MDHQIAPNGGGTLVNQYTIIWDMYCPGGGTLPVLQLPEHEQRAGGRQPLPARHRDGPGERRLRHAGRARGATQGWHRLAFAVDLSQNLITKWVDGVKAQDWVSSANGLDAARRAWQHTVLLFADGDGDDHDATSM